MKNKKARRLNKVIVIGVFSVLSVILLVSFIFFGIFIPRYKVIIQQETGKHLGETVSTLCSSISGGIDNDWLLALSYRDGLTSQSKDALIEQAEDMAHKYGFDIISIYTNEVSFDSQGNLLSEVEVNKRLTALGNKDRVLYHSGDVYEYLYAISGVEVQQEGASIVAVGIHRNMLHLLDNYGLQPFDGTVYAYLADSDGKAVAVNTTSPTRDGDLLADIEEGDNTYFEERTQLNLHTLDKLTVFIHTDSIGEYYCIVTPVSDTNSKLVYFVPTLAVNRVLQEYYNIVVGLCAIIIVLISILSLSLLFVLYRIYSRRMSAELTSRDHLFSTLVSQTENVFALLRRNQKGYAYLSPNAERLFGANTPLLSLTDDGLHIDDSGTDVDYSSVRASLEAWNGQGNYTSNYVSYTVDSKERFVVLMLYPNKDDADEYIAIAQDVTEERRREQLLANALTVAETANKAKSVFLANVSHDIRTPMNAIINVTRFAKENANDPTKVLEYMDIVERSSHLLLQLINDLLDMSRVESNKLIINSQKMNICDLLQEVCDVIQPLCDGKRQTYTVTKDASSIEVMGDAVKLRQVLINLLNNAVKFTPNGGNITFNVTHHLTMNERIVVDFTITDNGIGIAQENLGQVFQPFMRVTNEHLDVEGTGLGLSIVKSFVEAMGGTVSVTSQLGVGTTFAVSISFAAAAKEEVKKTTGDVSAVLSGTNVLVAEDNQLNRRIINLVLTKLGINVTLANNGKELVELFTASPINTYQCVLTDIYMPIMDGYEATKAIRALQRADASLPIIAVSANVFAEDMDKGAKCGLDDYIGKPIDIGTLKAVLLKHLYKEIDQD